MQYTTTHITRLITEGENMVIKDKLNSIIIILNKKAYG